MNNSWLPWVIVGVLLLAAPTHAQYSAELSDPVLLDYLVEFADDVKLPAKEAGVLVHLAVKEGDQVKAGDEIARIDDQQAQMQKKVAYFGFLSAAKRSQDDVEIRYSKVAADTAKADYDDLLESNELHEKAITATDIRRAKLEWDKGVLQIERAGHDKVMAE